MLTRLELHKATMDSSLWYHVYRSVDMSVTLELGVQATRPTRTAVWSNIGFATFAGLAEAYDFRALHIDNIPKTNHPRGF